MPRPAQVQGPAPGSREVDQRRPSSVGKFNGGGSAGAIERGPNRQRGTGLPRHPEDLVPLARKRRGVQSVAAGPEDGDDRALFTHHMRHRHVRRAEAGTGPGRQRAKDKCGRASFFCRRRSTSGRLRASAARRRFRRTRCVTGRAPGRGQPHRQQYERITEPHASDRMPVCRFRYLARWPRPTCAGAHVRGQTRTAHQENAKSGGLICIVS